MNNRYFFMSPGTETKFRILHSFDRPIEQISVSQLCERCNISRPTFYSHFDSKYSVSFWLLNLAFDLYLKEIGRTLSWDEGVQGYFRFLYGEKDSLRYAFVEAPSRKETETRLADRKQTIVETLSMNGHSTLGEDLLFYIEFFVNTGNYLTVTWCQNEMPYDAHTYARYFTECMPKNLITALNKNFM